jgi:hypothetical protein
MATARQATLVAEPHYLAPPRVGNPAVERRYTDQARLAALAQPTVDPGAELTRMEHVDFEVRDELRDLSDHAAVEPAMVFDLVHAGATLARGLEQRMLRGRGALEHADVVLDAQRIEMRRRLEDRAARAVDPRRVAQMENLDGISGHF